MAGYGTRRARDGLHPRGDADQVRPGRRRRRRLGAQAPRRHARAARHRPGRRRAGIADRVARSIEAEGIEVVVYDRAPRRADARLVPGRRRLRASRRSVDGFVSVGGGSAIDTAKVADLIATHPAPVMDYVNPPVGGGPQAARRRCSRTWRSRPRRARARRRRRSPCSTSPTCSSRPGISHRYLRPAQAIVDPELTRTLPAEVAAATGLDVVCHAAESFLSRPYDARARPDDAGRPAALPGREPGGRRVVAEGARVRRALPAPRGRRRRRRRGARVDDARRLDGRRRLRLGGRAHPARLRVSDRRAQPSTPARLPDDHASSRTASRSSSPRRRRSASPTRRMPERHEQRRRAARAASRDAARTRSPTCCAR